MTAAGEIIFCQWNNGRITDDSGAAVRLLTMAEDITEKRKLEQDRIWSEAKFAGAFQCNPDPISISRISDGQILDVNQSFETVTGFSRDETLGKNSRELNLWADLDERDALIKQFDRSKTVRDFASSMRTRNGDIRLVLSNTTIFEVAGEAYQLSVIRDVTEQRRLQLHKAEIDRALHRLTQWSQRITGESFFQMLVDDLASALQTEHAMIGLLEGDAPGQVYTLAVHDRGAAADNYRYSFADAPCEDILTGEICLYASGIQQSFPRDHVLVTQGWDSYAGAPIRDAAGNTIGLLAVMDSRPLGNPELVKSLLQVYGERASAELEREHAEEALLESERSFSTIFQASPVAMCVIPFGGDYPVKDVNDAFERLFLRPREVVVGTMSQLALFEPDAQPAASTGLFDGTGVENNREYWMRRGDGSPVLVEISRNSFDVFRDKFTILACEDITDKRRIENEIRELNANLEHRVVERTDALRRANLELASTLETLNRAQEELVGNEKLAALGSLVAGVAHELNTPIGNSLMAASTLVDLTHAFNRSYGDGLTRSTLERYVSDAGKAGDILVRNLYRAADLITSFKQVAVDQTSSQRRVFSLLDVVSEILLTLSPAIRKSLFSVKHDIPATLRMDSYPGPLGQVLANLINNALIHGFEGRDRGTITITAQAMPDGWLELCVRDDGVGIPSEHLKRIYDPFFTTKLGAGGSGLGLNITHNIVTGILGGRIQVNSEPDVGTSFILSLPVIAPQMPREDKTVLPVPESMSSPSLD
ncbi:PAS domain S-box protein [Undibacterium arcticum]|uniref:PAS domain-containing sensor histidine kinase n=1 Tax=Undibacterium arcticum TaxID=1762892 RepID=UPI00360B8128